MPLLCIKSIQTCFAFSKNTSLIVSSAFGYAYVSSLRIVRFGISFAVFLDFFQVGCIKILLSSNLCVWRLSVWGFGVWVFRCLRLCSLTRGSWAPEFPVLSSQFPLTRSQFSVPSFQFPVVGLSGGIDSDISTSDWVHRWVEEVMTTTTYEHPGLCRI